MTPQLPIEQQIFRRLGYSAGLNDILKIFEIISLFRKAASISRTSLLNELKRQQNINTDYAQGRLDVTKTLGFISLFVNNYALSPAGRAVMAFQSLGYPPSDDVFKFILFKKILMLDGDIILTLFEALREAKPDGEMIKEIFLTRLIKLLEFKRSAVRVLPIPKFTRDRLIFNLDVSLLSSGNKQSKNRKKPPFGGNPRPKKLSLLDLPRDKLGCQHELQDYLRHTVDPRRVWLAEFGIYDSKKGSITGRAERFEGRLNELGFMTEGGPTLPPLEKDLKQLLKIDRIFCKGRFDGEALSSLVSSVFVEKIKCNSLDDNTFLDLLKRAYDKVKLESFQQAEVEALDEVVSIPLLLNGSKIDFASLLEGVLSRKSGVVSRLSSRRIEGGYIAFRRSKQL